MIGIWTLFPFLLHTPLSIGFHSMLTLLFAFNTRFNYTLASFTSPGASHTPAHVSLLKKPHQGAYAHYRFCKPCQSAKPPDTHHCRLCETCIIDMDHHCPFISNCVGRRNLRPFIIFLAYAVTSCAYLGSMTTYAITQHMEPFSQVMMGRATLHYSRAHGGLKDRVRLCPIWCGGALWITSADVVLSVGLLLVLQLRYISQGVPTLTKLTGAKQRDQAVDNFRAVFGPGHPITWVLPRFRTPQGAHCSSLPLREKRER